MRRTRLCVSLALILLGTATPAAFAADPVGGVLQVSARPDRSGAVALAGATAPSNAYIVLAAPSGVTRVTFQLDGTTNRQDVSAPFDLRGSRPDGRARPVVLAAGRHTVSAIVVSAGATTTVSAQFTVGGPPVSPSFSANAGRPYTAASAFNLPVPLNPVTDTSSPSWVAQLGAPGNAQSALLDETGVAIYDADASTPRYQVQCTENWGSCPLAAGPVPVPLNAVAPTGADGALVVIDWSTRRSYEFWQARRTATGWQASWGSVTSIDGDGYDATGASPTGAGIPRLAGVVRLREIAAGRIDHALVFATGISARGTFRYPASKTDGGNMFGSAMPLPEGARIQLDPAVNVDAIPGITSAEKSVAKALQTYGAYNIDNGGYHAMGLSFETARAGQPSPYAAAGLGWDYAGMTHIPWNQLRVLRQWDGH